jgi:hypothetical protein
LGIGFIARWDFGRIHDFNRMGNSFNRFFIGWNY